METTFLNVTLTIEAKNPKLAYKKLCDGLVKGLPSVEWTTDTYFTSDAAMDTRSTVELFPKSK